MRAGGFGLLCEAASVPAVIGGSPVAVGEIGGVVGNRDDAGDDGGDEDRGAAGSGDRADCAPGRSGGRPPGGTEWDIGVGDQDFGLTINAALMFCCFN
ncbi:MAG: hypothetical protein QM766_14945 [Burkholderiaceae bacterium]